MGQFDTFCMAKGRGSLRRIPFVLGSYWPLGSAGASEPPLAAAALVDALRGAAPQAAKRCGAAPGDLARMLWGRGVRAGGLGGCGGGGGLGGRGWGSGGCGLGWEAGGVGGLGPQLGLPLESLMKDIPCIIVLLEVYF